MKWFVFDPIHVVLCVLCVLRGEQSELEDLRARLNVARTGHRV